MESFESAESMPNSFVDVELDVPTVSCWVGIAWNYAGACAFRKASPGDGGLALGWCSRRHGVREVAWSLFLREQWATGTVAGCSGFERRGFMRAECYMEILS